MSPPTLPLGEFDVIGRYFAAPTFAVPRADVVLGIGDDAALLRVPADCELAVSVDTLVAGRHFPHDCTPRSIGHRALAVNLSDLAAMGATPAWATLALTMPTADADWLDAFAAGFAALARAYDVALVGGDTTSGPLAISVQIMGHVARGTALRRGGARPGDLLIVTGTLGDSGAGLAIAQGTLAGCKVESERDLRRRFDYPSPRVAFGVRARGVASAAMDLSDGLIGDLPKLTAASGLAAVVDVARLPLSAALQDAVSLVQARDWALAAGDDYELLMAVPPARIGELQQIAHELNLTLTTIGELRAGAGLAWTLDGAPYRVPEHGYDHFR